MPPIINSNHTGRVTLDTTEIFIECSGFDVEKLSTALNVIVAALYDRGAKIESVEIEYENKKIVTPNFTEKNIEVEKEQTL
jgi:phenylalanyl-tRNA synthetase beta chain